VEGVEYLKKLQHRHCKGAGEQLALERRGRLPDELRNDGS
jgi:hypothetical protein